MKTFTLLKKRRLPALSLIVLLKKSGALSADYKVSPGIQKGKTIHEFQRRVSEDIESYCTPIRVYTKNS